MTREQTDDSRRRFLKAAGAAGASTAMAGFVGRPYRELQANATTIQWAGNQVDRQNVDGITEALRSAGMSDSIQLEVIVTSDISDDVQSQFRQWLQAGRNRPDIMRMDSGWTIPFIVRDQLYNLSENLPQEAVSRVMDRNFQASVDTATGPNGDLFGVPYFSDFPTIQYRKDLVTEAGFDPDGNNWGTEPMSWQRFSEVIAQTQENSGQQYGYAWQADNYEGLSCCTFNELMTTWGGAYFGGLDNLFGPVGDRPVSVTEEPVLNALRMGRTFIHGQDDQHSLEGYQQISPEATLQWTEGPTQSAFLEGNAVSVRWWPSNVFAAAEEFGDSLGVMPIPYGVTPDEAQYEGTGGTASALGGWHLTMNPNSQNQEAALEVLAAVTSQEFREFEFQELGYIPSDASILRSDVAQEDDVWGPYIDTLRLAGENAVPRPTTVVWPDESSQIAQRVNATLAQQTAPEQAMSQLADALEQIEQSV